MALIWYGAEIPEGTEWNETKHIDVEVTDNPVIAELLGPDGSPIRQWRARPVIGFHSKDRR